MLLLAISVFTWAKIAVNVLSGIAGIANNIDLSLFSSVINNRPSILGRPGWVFLTFAVVDLIAIGFVMSVYFLNSETGFLQWSVLLSIIVYFIIKATYFIRIFHTLGVLDENEQFDEPILRSWDNKTVQREAGFVRVF